MYEPNDEREKQLYFLAYQRCSKIFLGYILFICTTYVLSKMGVSAYTFSLDVYIVFALIILVLALVSASVIFRHEDISLKNRKNYYWQLIRNELWFIVFAILFNSVLFTRLFGVVDHIQQLYALDSIMQTVSGVLFIVTIGTVIIGGIYVTIRKRKQ